MRRFLIISVCFCVIGFAWASRAGGQSLRVDTFPTWTSAPANLTRSIATDDFDRDGHLDLAAGNLSQSNIVFRGQPELFSAPAWQTLFVSTTSSIAIGDLNDDGFPDLVSGNGTANWIQFNDGAGILPDFPQLSIENLVTGSVAIGDVDGDGDLDLAFGNINGANSLYLNDGGVFPSIADWKSVETSATRSVALGDINGDGRLDLVCGNALEPNTAYLNTGTVFDTVSAWFSDTADLTTGVCLGDVDGDGALDLVCSNFEGPNLLYFNSGDSLSTFAGWTSATTDSTLAVDLGDVDKDGDLDLLLGNESQPNVIYRNSGGSFEGIPAWRSTTANRTAAVGFIDGDGDGDLDVICGNSGESNLVFVNNTEPLPGNGGWFSFTTDSTLDIALVDVDLDGDLDLIAGNNGESALYRNTGGTFETLPSWRSSPPRGTGAVALGDVNGDGYPDLVCANAGIPGEPNALYLNVGGTFAPTPAWETSAAYVTTGVALGDVNADGLLDIVCGNSNQRFTAYFNSGGTFPVDPDWTSGSGSPTTDIALGDLTGDGLPELVCARTGQDNWIYRGTLAGFERSPAWYSSPRNASSSVALGDVDGNGDLDIVFGNVNQANTVYLNFGGVVDLDPDWSVDPGGATATVALGDFDGDGDLDLACGNLNEPNTVYRNASTSTFTSDVFLSEPAWASLDSTRTNGVAWGDVDGDGDLDLVTGNEQQSNVVYHGKKNPPFVHDPFAPTNQRTNTTAYLSNVQIGDAVNNARTVVFTCVDVESDPVGLVMEYRFHGDQQWRPADLVAGPLEYAGSPAGVTDSVTWDISLVPFDSRDVVVRLKAIENPRWVAAMRSIQSSIASAGRVVPIRSEITIPPLPLAFQTVTFGDTVTSDLVVTNTGTSTLTVIDVALPSTEMELDVVTPADIAVGASDTFRVSLRPETDVDVTGNIAITSNDPVTPVKNVDVVTDIRPLDVKTRLATGSPEIPLGDAATVIVEPAPEVRIESGVLFHRPAGTTAFDSIPLAFWEGGLVAVIPGDAVTEAGIEYYIRVDNAPVSLFDPPGAPADSVFFQAVETPTTVAASPRATPEGDFPERTSIRVDVTLPRGTVFESGSLYYRPGGVRGGAASFDRLDLALDGTVPTATIPDSVVTERGVEYWVEVRTLFNTLTSPAFDPADNPASISVTVGDLLQPTSRPGRRYHLFSVPLRMRGGIIGSVADELGGNDVTQWRMFEYVPGDTGYSEVPNDDVTGFEQGKSYWLISRSGYRIGTGPDRGNTTPTDRPFDIVLKPGYNLIASPFTFDVAWDSCSVDTFPVTDTLAAGIVEPPVEWVDGAYVFDADRLVPFDGYWVKNLTGSAVTLHVPPKEATVPAPVSRSQSVEGWRLAVIVRSDDIEGYSATIGESGHASDEWDRSDRSLPPPAPGEAVFVYFPRTSWSTKGGLYARDIRAPAGEDEDGSFGNEWRFDVGKTFSRGSAGDEVSIRFDGHIPDDREALLIDRRLNHAVDLRAHREYRFFLGRKSRVYNDGDARFALLVGDDRYVEKRGNQLRRLPTKTALFQNYPNPFNPSTVIRYDVASGGWVSLRIYTVDGALVKVLEEGRRAPGRYEVGWNGTNSSGEGVATGVYFYRLVADNESMTRKMLLLK